MMHGDPGNGTMLRGRVSSQTSAHATSARAPQVLFEPSDGFAQHQKRQLASVDSIVVNVEALDTAHPTPMRTGARAARARYLTMNLAFSPALVIMYRSGTPLAMAPGERMARGSVLSIPAMESLHCSTEESNTPANSSLKSDEPKC